MIDFGLKPCPLCGGVPEVSHLAQGPEDLTAVIRCTSCGLTLQWETEIKVGVSRSGKRIPVKAGPDPIEAWNRRATEEREPLLWLDDKPGWECPTCGFTCEDPYYLGAGKFCPECAQPLRFRGAEEATP